MSLAIITADQRLADANSKTTMAIFGPSGVGKTSLLKTLPPEITLCVDLEAGMTSVQDWPGDSIPIRAWPDAVDIACLIGGIDPAVDASAFFSQGHYQHVAETYPDLVRLVAHSLSIVLDEHLVRDGGLARDEVDTLSQVISAVADRNWSPCGYPRPERMQAAGSFPSPLYRNNAEIKALPLESTQHRTLTAAEGEAAESSGKEREICLDACC